VPDLRSIVHRRPLTSTASAGDRYSLGYSGSCDWSVGPPATGILDSVSSKTARLHRRQEARRKKDKRKRKSGRVPQHTRAERKRAQAERQLHRQVEQSRQAWLRRGAVLVLTSTGVASLAFLAPAEVSSGHHMYQYVSAAGFAWPGNPDLPHPPEPDMTFSPPFLTAGTASTAARVRRVAPVSWDGSERYGMYGPIVFGAGLGVALSRFQHVVEPP